MYAYIKYTYYNIILITCTYTLSHVHYTLKTQTSTNVQLVMEAVRVLVQILSVHFIVAVPVGFNSTQMVSLAVVSYVVYSCIDSPICFKVYIVLPHKVHVHVTIPAMNTASKHSPFERVCSF